MNDIFLSRKNSIEKRLLKSVLIYKGGEVRWNCIRRETMVSRTGKPIDQSVFCVTRCSPWERSCLTPDAVSSHLPSLVLITKARICPPPHPVFSLNGVGSELFVHPPGSRHSASTSFPGPNWTKLSPHRLGRHFQSKSPVPRRLSRYAHRQTARPTARGDFVVSRRLMHQKWVRTWSLIRICSPPAMVREKMRRIWTEKWEWSGEDGSRRRRRRPNNRRWRRYCWRHRSAHRYMKRVWRCWAMGCNLGTEGSKFPSSCRCRCWNLKSKNILLFDWTAADCNFESTSSIRSPTITLAVACGFMKISIFLPF